MDITTSGPRLTLVGDLDGRSTFEVRSALYAHAEDHDRTVVDVSAVTNVDVIALKMLAVASRRMSQQGRPITLRGCSPSLLRLAHKSHLRGLLSIEPTALSA